MVAKENMARITFMATKVIKEEKKKMKLQGSKLKYRANTVVKHFSCARNYTAIFPLLLMSCKNLGKLLNYSMPQYSRAQKVDNNSTHFTGLWRELNKFTY